MSRLALPYRRPRLTRYGRIQAVTTGQSGPFDDGSSGKMSTMQGGGGGGMGKTMVAGGPLGGV